MASFGTQIKTFGWVEKRGFLKIKLRVTHLLCGWLPGAINSRSFTM